MNLTVIKGWLKSLTLWQILPILISIIALLMSWNYSKKAIGISEESLAEAQRSNKIAKEASVMSSLT
jgi:hypothetical protein